MAISHFPQTKLPLVAFTTLFLMLLNRVHSSDSLSFTFNNFNPNQRDIILQGDSQIPSTGTIQLTKTDTSGNPVRNSVGRALYSTPVRLWDSNTGRRASFETNFTFVLASTAFTSDQADGFAFFIAPPDTYIPAGSVGGFFGLFTLITPLPLPVDTSLNRFVAVEFDTYFDNAWDPNYPHIGIDVDSVKSLRTTRWERKNGTIATAHISYNAASKVLSVVSFYPNSGQDYRVSHKVDLETVLPEWVRIGFSGATGDAIQNHNILSWSFSSSLESENAKKDDMYIARYV